jgi:CheY-like chemotaxis protein/predicted regulator of Ras-like GTPase activity (Roadblock/LC7/MglB family)
MNIKRVLIVDDDASNAIMIRDILQVLGDDYVFEIAYNGDEALALVEERSYDLVITDYFMPGLSGMNLIDKIRNIYPNTKIILMTAEGSKMLEKVAKYRNVDHYITKPFSLKKIREIVQLAVAEPTLQPDEEQSQYESPLLDEPPKEACRSPQADKDDSQDQSDLLDDYISELLKALKAQTGVRSVLLVSSEGYPVDVAGEIAELDISSASALVAASFMASSELACLFGHRNSTFNSSYYEGDDCNIYCYDINGKMLLAVVFDIQIKPGLVSYYSKQTISKLAPLLAQQPASLSWDKEEFDETLIAEQLDELFNLEL